MTIAKWLSLKILPASVCVCLSPWAVSAQSVTTFGALNLIVTISGQIGQDSPFGAGIIFGHEKDAFYIVTANHVVRSGNRAATGLEIRVNSSRNTAVKTVSLLKFDADLDIAVLRVDGLAAKGVDACKPRLDRLSKSIVNRGDGVYAVGNPNGEGWFLPVRPDQVNEKIGDAIRFESTVISIGNSGGALLDGEGDLVGMVQKDQPPTGRALDIQKVLTILKQWNYPVQLRVHGNEDRLPLLAAAEDLDIPEVQSLLHEPCTDVNAKDDNGITALHEALGIIRRYSVSRARIRQIKALPEVVGTLLDAGADPNASTRSGETPLLVAAFSGNTKMVSLLLARGAKVDSRNSGELLIAAASRGSVDLVKLFTGLGADVNSVDTRGESALYHAVQADGRMDGAAALEFLLGAGAVVDLKSIHEAISRRDEKALRLLLAAHGPVDFSKMDGWYNGLNNFFDSRPESRPMAALLLAAGARPGQEHLNMAVELGWTDIVAAMIKANISVGGAAKSGGDGILQKAIVGHHPEIVRLLLEAGADPNVPGPPYSMGAYGSYWAPLCMALVRDTPPDLGLAALLVAHGANVNVVDLEGRSILEKAITQKRPGVVEFLIKAGARRTSPAK